MKLLTLEVISPATHRSYDHRLPAKMKIADLKLRLMCDICEYEGIDTIFSEDLKDTCIFGEKGLLCDDLTIEGAGVKNGDKIMIL